MQNPTSLNFQNRTSYLNHPSDRFTERFGRIGRPHILIGTTIEKIPSKTPVKTLLRHRLKRQLDPSRRSGSILWATLKNFIQTPPIPCRNILHIRQLFESPFYLQRSRTGIEQSLQPIGTIHIFKGKQMLVANKRTTIGIEQCIGKTAILGTFPAIGASSRKSTTQITLSAITDTQSSMHKNFQLHRHHLGNGTYLLTR